MSRPAKGCRVVGGANAGKDFAAAQFTHIEMQLQQLVGAGYQLGAQYLGDTQIDAQKIIDRNQIAFDRGRRRYGRGIRRAARAAAGAGGIAASGSTRRATTLGSSRTASGS